MSQSKEQAGEAFVKWLEAQVIADARGDYLTSLSTKPADSLWLGRLAPEGAEWREKAGPRGERLDPSSAGIRFRPSSEPPWRWVARVTFRVWFREGEGEERHWRKSERISAAVEIVIPDRPDDVLSFGSTTISDRLSDAGHDGHSARIDVESSRRSDGWSVAVVLVNDTEDQRGADSNLYEVEFAVEVGEIQPFVLDALPDSFRYDRRVSAYGINGGFEFDGSTLKTCDVIVAERKRPVFWDESVSALPDLRFDRLARDPLPPLRDLVGSLESWGRREWSETRLSERATAEGWSAEMKDEALAEAAKYEAELKRCYEGLSTLSQDTPRTAFQLMNEAFRHSGADRYYSWRPFQMGFFLAALPSIVDARHESRTHVETLWFATGGGKTETYLALVVFACLLDRLNGKHHGITAWSRFPLRMLSLQQTQRFADALAGAELARRRHSISGDPFALGFFVGRGGTPNRLRDEPKEGQDDANDPELPRRNQVLLRCPFCRSTELDMRFSRRYWRLEHVCTNSGCTWPDEALPFYVVDEEIYRFLPSVVIGTLDKAASVAIQAAMRGLYAAPIGKCDRDGHGFAYAPRSYTSGCLVPGCSGSLLPLEQDPSLFSPSLRLQDELHLLRGSLGAIDAHYETLLDHLTLQADSNPAKLVASSATLSGYHEQVQALYCREGHAFPLPGPEQGASLWMKDSDETARRFVGLAPRGVTQEFANDRMAESLQRAIRRLLESPNEVCLEAGVDTGHAEFVVSFYGTHVVYGNKIRDVEAAARSFDTQPGVEPLNVATLTGATPLENVRDALERLDKPEEAFEDRLHIVCASSMMSHGVDVDRFNVITMLGMPLATAEFIQTTARIGRRYPGLVLVIHRMAIERDSSVFRAFDVFVRHAERFIEPIAITRRSRRVLRHTFPGMFMSRVLGVHEANSVLRGGKQLTTISALRQYTQSRPLTEEDEFEALCNALCLDSEDVDDPLVVDLRRMVRDAFRELNDPATSANFPTEILSSAPMLSLREVETQIPIFVDISRGRR